MSGKTAKAARRATAARYAREAARSLAVSSLAIDVDALIAAFEGDGGHEAPVDRDPEEIRTILGRRDWGPQIPFATGWRFQRYDGDAIVLVTAACWPELPDVPVIHASISRRDTIPSYDDLQLLHRAVWPAGNALQAFVPSSDHINIRPNVLHLWGRADGARLWPIDFGRYGTI